MIRRPSSQTSSLRLASLAILGLTAGVTASAMSGGCIDAFDARASLHDVHEWMHPKRDDLTSEGTVTAQAVSGPMLEVGPPVVTRYNDDLIVKGSVTRKADADGQIPGFLDLRVIGPDGVVIDQDLIKWAPERVPTDGNRTSLYTARILGVPPAGSTVRVAYVASLRDLPEIPAGPGAGGGTAAEGGHTGNVSRGFGNSSSNTLGSNFGAGFSNFGHK